MQNEWFPFLFILMMLVVLLEMILSSAWNRAYFRHGLLVFLQEHQGIPSAYTFPSVTELEEALKGRFSQSIVFKCLGENEYAFREKAWEFTLFNSSPVMHGLLRWRPERGRITVEGRLNWFIMAFATVWFIATIPQSPSMVVFFVLFVVALYAIQARRFKQVARKAAEKCLKA